MLPPGDRRLSNAGILLLALALVVVVLLVWQSSSAGGRANAGADGRAAGVARDTAETAEVPSSGGAAEEVAVAEAASEAEDEAEERAAAPRKVESTRQVVPGVRGRALDRDEQPVAGALVLLGLEAGTLPWPLDARGPEGRLEPLGARTDDEGRFLIEEAPLGDLRLALRRPGFAPLDVEELSLLRGEVLDVGDLTLMPAAVLGGVVVDERNAALPGARLFSLGELLPGPADTLSERNGAHVATTDDLGLFRIDTLRPGRWRLLVVAEEHPEQVFEGRRDLLDGPLEGLVLQLGQGASLAGRVVGAERELPLVVHALPLRRVGREGERGAWPNSHETLAGYRSAEVDAWGSFALDGLVPREPYLLRARKRGQPASSRDPYGESLEVRAGARDVELPYGASAVLAFQATDAARGTPVEELEVSIEGAWPPVATDGAGNPRDRFPEGRVLVESVRPLELDPDRPFPDLLESVPCRVTVLGPAHEPVFLEDVRFTAGLRTDLGRVLLTPLPVLRLRVVDDATGEPLEGARVSARDRFFPRAERTDREGRAELVLPSAREPSLVSVSADGYVPAGKRLSAAACASPEPYEFRLTGSLLDSAGGAVEVLARDRAGAPLTSFDVLRAPRASRPVDRAGRAVFLVGDPEPRAFALRARPRLGRMPDVEPLWRLASAGPGELTTLVLVDRPLERLLGTVLLNGLPLADARLRVTPGAESLDRLTEEWEHGYDVGEVLGELGYVADTAPSGVRAGLAANRTDDEGRFAFEEVAPGMYSILIDHAGTGIRTRRVVRAGPTELTIDVGDTEIAGTVTDEAGVPLAGAPVHLVVEGSYPPVDVELPVDVALAELAGGVVPFATTHTDFRGRYRVDAVPPGLRLGIVVRAGEQVGSRWGVSAEPGRTLEGQDVLVSPAASLDVIVERETSRDRLAVILVSPYRPLGLGTMTAVVDDDDVARFGGLDAGEWQLAAVLIDEFDRLASSPDWEDVTLDAGEHHEAVLVRLESESR